jgi:protein-S-isoprenylcysteine O-methyltransferase Ste14
LSIEDRDEIGKFPLSHVLKMFVLVRAITYAALFIGFVLVYLPGRFLSWSGITRPEFVGAPQIGGMLVGAIGAVLALWCLLTFAFIGKGTPAPFDPPRRLVIRGPYRFVRNPMYIGAATALAGTALFYQSWSLLLFTGLFLLATHLFVISYEEPTLRRTFGKEYEAYCIQVNRWLVRSSPRNEAVR